MKRLAYLISQYPTISHTFLVREIRGLRELGFDIDVVTIRPADRELGQLSEVELAETGRAYCVKRSGPWLVFQSHLKLLIGSPRQFVSGFAFALGMAGADVGRMARHVLYFGEAVLAGAWFKQRGHTHVHTHFASTVTAILGHLYPIRYSCTIHGSDEFIDPIGFRMREKVRNAAFVVAISDFGRSQIMRFSDADDWERIVVARLGVEVARSETRSYVPANGRPFEFLSVGRLVAVKAYRILLEACAILARRGQSFRLTLVGDGPERQRLERMSRDLAISDWVRFEGTVASDRVSDYYRHADAFVLTSLAEGVPVVLMEAMASGLPCIGTRVTGIPELICDGKDGLLVSPANYNELANSMERFMEDGELRERLGQAARSKIELEYDLAKNVAHLACLFEGRVR